MVKGTPNGDAKMVLSLEQKDRILAGTITNGESAEPVKLTNVEEKETSVTVYFSASGYDVYLLMDKKDDDHVTGSMMDMFDAEGERIKATN